MKRNIVVIVVCAATLGVLAGCSKSAGLPIAFVRIDNAIERYEEASQGVELGDRRTEVLALLEPTQTGLRPRWRKPPERFIREGTEIHVHYFRSRRYPDDRTTDNEFTPYVFANDELVAVGWSALGGARSYARPGAKMSPEGRNTEGAVGGITPAPSSYGQKVYDASECVGPVVNGVCRGSILPNKAQHPTCYGQMLNGECTGPQF